MTKSNKEFKKKFKRVSSNYALVTLRFLFRILPRWIIYPFAEFLFFIAMRCTKNLQKICQNNLRSVYQDSMSENECQVKAKQCLKNVGYSMLDMLYYVERPNRFGKVVEIDGLERLDAVLKQKKGVLGITAHLGNFPLMFMALSQRGYKVNVIIRPMRNKGFSEFMFSLCDVWGINMIPTLPSQFFLKETLKSLKENELLFILFDEIPNGDDGVDVDFFGRKVQRAEGPILFNRRMGAPILPIFIRKESNSHFKIEILEEFKCIQTANSVEDSSRNLNGMTSIIEQQIRLHPIQWGGWFNKRWQNTRV